MSRTLLIAALHLLLLPALAVAGPFDSYLTNGVSPASITAWANAVADYAPTDEVVGIDSFGFGPHNDPTRGLGPADFYTVSLGDLTAPKIAAGTAPGNITVRFQQTIFDGPGADLAVFENAGAFFNSHSVDFVYGELAFVEVSSNGTDFARFPATSLNIEVDPNSPDLDLDQLHTPFGRDFAGINTTNVNNLAGIHPALVGTPFDLGDLAGDPLVTGGAVDLNAIRYVRMVDVPGEGSFTDSLGNPILDPWHSVESGGFDLDAVGAIHAVPEPAAIALASGVALGTLLCRIRRPSGPQQPLPAA